MTSFGWKRKIGEHVSKSSALAFKGNTGAHETEDEECNVFDWLDTNKRFKISLEDASSKSKRLIQEGNTLAEAERYWEAINKWNEALQLTPHDETLYEMKAQVLMILHEHWPAIKSAENAVKISPTWWQAYQTLGRAQLGQGEILLAKRNFSKAVHICPVDDELWKEDLLWAHSLWKEKLARDEVHEKSDNST
ncbi:tetratricopeptide repeat protein 33-like [Anneissia japonica]|uniref:tetratricopeptide repeat protein 33-like n=1 Tax=Anneissia japonica TaxID=1529436 RepID=UPI0014259946|nr:tetratricopeptide repeat protein 33-like [Anneissia japonica]XP_033096805.1 tetratricopeptide repeat protein 33-like [Anneissia japonica]